MKNCELVRHKLWPWIAFALLLMVTVFQLHRQGRIWWCACARPFLWHGNIWSSHNSQHLLDPYSFTHVLHGVVFCGLVWLAFPRIRLVWRLWIASTIEALWEILENTNFVIQRYREVTISLGYNGDSIANSMADIACCAIGSLLAWRLGLRRSIILFVATELVLLVCVRDNLTLNVLMLLCPIEAIKSWQMID